MKFTEAVRWYSEEKKARGLSPVVNAKEIDKIRKLYKDGKFNENCGKKTEMNKAQKAEFEKTLKEFRDYKESKGMGRGVSTKQKKMIERTILCGTLTSPVSLDENEKTIIAGPSSAKMNEAGAVICSIAIVVLLSGLLFRIIKKVTVAFGKGAIAQAVRITKDIKDKLLELLEDGRTEVSANELTDIIYDYINSDVYNSVRAERGDTTYVDLSSRREYIHNIVVQYLQANRIDFSESNKKAVRSKILEARKNIFIAKAKLRENDMMGAADATQAAGNAVNAADAAIANPAAQGAVPQNIVDTVASLQTTVNDLATQCGIQPPVDVGADPNAGVPAVDGATPDPNAQAGAAPVMEGLASTKARLAKREALLRAIKEGAAAPSNGQDAMVQEINSMTNPQEFHNIDKKDSEELVKPTVKKSPEAANTWPTVKGTYKESVTEKMISDRIAENEDRWDFSRILKEGILG